MILTKNIDFKSKIGYNKFVRRNEYNKIYLKIKKQILAGQYASGQKLSPERQFCQQFDVSRITIRHALRLLEEDGLVERFQGKGSFIKNIKPTKLPITEMGFAKSVKKYAPGLYRELLKNEFVTAPKQISVDLNLDKQKCLLAIRTDVLNDEVIAFDKAYIMQKYCNCITEELLTRVDFFEKWVKDEKIKIDYSNETLEATEAEKQSSAILNVKLGSAILKATEIYYDNNNKPIAIFKSYYRGDKIKLTSTIGYKK